VNRKQTAYAENLMRVSSKAAVITLALAALLNGCCGLPIESSPTPNALSPISPVSSPLATPLPPEISLSGKFVFHLNMHGAYDIYSLDGDGKTLQQLTFAAGRDIEPSWSPDGNRIAFASDRDDPTGLNIYVMNADGSDQHPLTQHAGYALSPSWAPDSKRLVFHTNWEARFQLYTIGIDGGEPQKLHDVPGNAYMPSWSPDGSRIAFVGDQDGGNDDIYILNLDTKSIERITDDPERDLWPAWSPDGDKIAYQHHVGGKKNIVVYDVGTGTRQTVLDDDYNDATPAWVGDNYIVCSSTQNEPPWTLNILDFEGNRYLLADLGQDSRHPNWTGR
jgi:Tol biopolymer transport system component